MALGGRAAVMEARSWRRPARRVTAAHASRSREPHAGHGWRELVESRIKDSSGGEEIKRRYRRNLRDAVAAWRSGEQLKASGAACLQRRGMDAVSQAPTGWTVFSNTVHPWASFNRRMVDVRTRSAAYRQRAMGPWRPRLLVRQSGAGAGRCHGGGTWPRSAGKFGAAASPSH